MPRHEYLKPRGTKFLDALQAFTMTGRPGPEDIRNLTYRLVTKEDGERLAHSDAPWATAGLLVLRTPARDALAPLLSFSGAFVDLPGHEGVLHVYHSTMALDIVDWGKSVADWNADGVVVLPRSLVLKRDPPGGIACFRDETMPELFVTRSLVDRWESGGWQGLSFADIGDVWNYR